MFIITDDRSLYELSTSEFDKRDKPNIQIPYRCSRVLVNKSLQVVFLSVDEPNTNGSVVL